MTYRRYKITSLQTSLEERAYEIDGTTATIDIVLPQEPELSNNGYELQCEYELEIEIASRETEPVDDDDDDHDEDIVGEVEVEFTVVVGGSKDRVADEFSEMVDTWQEEGYRAMPDDFRRYLESGILSDVLAPISNLSVGLRGLLPGIAFSRGRPESEGDENRDELDEE